MQKRKGFTLVELVIVIAVIAILAGVLIGTFASVINRANESARQQEVKAQEIEQKAEDILKKIEDSNWYGWEDFEVSLVEKLEATYKKYANTSEGVTTEQIEKALKKVLEEYGKNAGLDNTNLTEEQVKAIVENAFGSFKYEGVTEAQVRAIVSAATTKLASTQLNAVQIKSIVTAANANNVTANQVAALLTEKLSGVATQEELNNKISEAVNQITNSITAAALTKEEVENIIKTYLPVTVTLTQEEGKSLQEVFDDAVNKYVSGSTLVLNDDFADAQLTIDTDDTKTLTLKGVDVNQLTVDAPNATIYVIVGADTVEVTSVAYNSLHLFKQVETLNITKGRVVLEQGVQVKNMIVNSEGLGDKVLVVVESGAKITEKLNVVAATGSVTVENKGTIELVVAEDDVPAGKAIVENISGGTVTNLQDSDDGNAQGLVIISDDTKIKTSVIVTNEDELTDALDAVKNGKAYQDVEAGNLSKIILGNNISVQNPIMIGESVTIDGNGHSITSSASRGFRVNESNKNVTIKNLTITGGNNFERAIQIDSSKLDVTLNIINVTTTSTFYAINICANTTCYLNVEDSKITGWGALNMWATGYLLTVNNSELNGINDKDKGNSNDFATVILEGDTTFATELHSSDNVVKIENTTITATQTKGNRQSLIGFNSQSENNNVQLIDCNFVYDGTPKTDLYYDNGTNNQLVIDDKVVNADKVTYYGDGWSEQQIFSHLFTKGYFMNNEHATLLTDVVLIENLPASSGLKSGETIYIELGDFTISGGNITLANGTTCKTDKRVDGLFVNENKVVITAQEDGGLFVYTATE